MKRKLLRLALAAAGLTLLILGLVHVADAFETVGSGGLSVVLPLQWVALTLIGAVACFLSYWLFRKRAQ